MFSIIAALKKVSLSATDIHKDVEKVAGLPTDKDNRKAVVAKLRAAAKRRGDNLASRKGNARVYIVRSADGMKALDAADPITRESKDSEVNDVLSDLLG